MPTQYIWVVFEPCCHLLPEHGEMVLHLLLVVVETLPVCVCVVCVGGKNQLTIQVGNRQQGRAYHVFPTASQK